MSEYTLMAYNFVNGNYSVSAVHALDLRKFIEDHPDARVYRI